MTNDSKAQITEQLATILEQVELAKEMWLNNQSEETLVMLRGALREVKNVVWRITPVDKSLITN